MWKQNSPVIYKHYQSIFMEVKLLLFLLLIFFIETSMLGAESQFWIRGTWNTGTSVFHFNLTCIYIYMNAEAMIVDSLCCDCLHLHKALSFSSFHRNL
jgi:hypothetical protein